MKEMRETWVDDVKVVACILVALGHFFQSMVTAEILAETGIYRWFNQTIYYFHVPLFFLCSGYLYQKKVGKGTPWSWQENVLRKGLTLGIPYVIFSVVTWLLKAAFSDSVNSQNGDLLRTLFLEPASPYWYLYTLFFIFLLIPRFSGRKAAVLVGGCAVFMKALRVCNLVDAGWYAIDSVMDNTFWFVLGMLLWFLPEEKQRKEARKWMIGMASSVVFLGASLLINIAQINGFAVSPIMGLWGCVNTVFILRNWMPDKKLRQTVDFIAKYTMPIFLMHTIFAAGLRAVLLKLGISAPLVHVVFGIAVSFAGPIVAAQIMEQLRLDFLLYPGRFFKKTKLKESQYV